MKITIVAVAALVLAASATTGGAQPVAQPLNAEAARSFAEFQVDAVIIDSPAGLTGHGAGGTTAFGRKFGPCLQPFIKNGSKQPPCS